MSSGYYQIPQSPQYQFAELQPHQLAYAYGEPLYMPYDRIINLVSIEPAAASLVQTFSVCYGQYVSKMPESRARHEFTNLRRRLGDPSLKLEPLSYRSVLLEKVMDAILIFAVNNQVSGQPLTVPDIQRAIVDNPDLRATYLDATISRALQQCS